MEGRNIRLANLVFGCTLIGLTAACGGGGGNGSGLLPPTELKIKEAGAYNYFVATWVAPAQTIDGYELEAKVGSAAPFQKVIEGLVPSDALSVQFYTSASVPELTPFAIRMRSIRGGLISEFTAPASGEVGIRKPENLRTTYRPTENAVEVTWDNRSLVALTHRIERSPLDSVGLPIGYVALAPVAGALNRHLDATVEEGSLYQYRLSSEAQGRRSAEVYASQVNVGLYAPTNLTASARTTEVRLRWDSRSTRTADFQIWRGPNSSPYFMRIVAIAPGASREYTDSGLASGQYYYKVVAVNPMASAESAVVDIRVP